MTDRKFRSSAAQFAREQYEHARQMGPLLREQEVASFDEQLTEGDPHRREAWYALTGSK